MKIQWYRSATVGIFSDSGTKILCDPWLTDGAFIGSWNHWPPLEGWELDEVLNIDWDYLYISHLHADHFDRRFVSMLAKAKPSLKVIVPFFDKKWLKRAVENCGFGPARVTEAPSGKPLEVGGIRVTILKANFCNPSFCGANTSCAPDLSDIEPIDSVAIFEADGKRILNANDALAVNSINHLWHKIGRVDMLLGHFGGAGPFPQCFPEISNEEKLVQANQLATKFIERLASAANILNVKYLFPYAGQYVLGGRLASLNPYRSVFSLSEAERLLTDLTNAAVITLAPFGEFSLGNGEADSRWIEPSNEVLKSYLAKKSLEKFPYEKKTTNSRNLQELLQGSAKNVIRKYQANLKRSDVFLKPHSVILGTEDEMVTMNFLGERSNVNLGEKPESESVTTVLGHPNLIFGITYKKPSYKGFTQLHFNQAEIGSHLIWKRTGEFNSVINYLNYFHTTGV